MSDILVLERQRGFRQPIGEVKEDVAESKPDVGLLDAGYAAVSPHLNRPGAHMERVARRLDLSD